jgi:hypothetical protein
MSNNRRSWKKEVKSIVDVFLIDWIDENFIIL